MRYAKSWDVASKDLKVFLKKKNIIFAILTFPLFISILLGFVINFILPHMTGSGMEFSGLLNLLNAFTFYYVIVAAVLPTFIASYSFVGEKVEKSLEPLLATPMTDEEILLGKGIAAFLPPIGATYLGASLYMVVTDILTHSLLGYNFFPNWDAGVILLVLTPLSAILSIEGNIIISSRVSDVRVSQQLGFLMVFPMACIYLASELKIILLDISTLLIISGVLLLIDLIGLYLTRVTFLREEILTKWT